MLSLSEDWPAKIYTSQFIYDILLKKKPRVHPKCFRVLKANVPMKFKSKDKVIWVTMFESDEMKNSVMFHFDDNINKYLYTGVFNEIDSCFANEHFMGYMQKEIDYVYINTMLCNSNPYICTRDIIDEIKQISLKHQDSKIAVIIPNFGYEKLLIHLVRAFPQNVYPTKTQRYILTKLGHSEYIGTNGQTCRIIIFLPGIPTEFFETDFITIYITTGNSSTLDNEYGVYLRQWYPAASLMDLQVLLEMIRPNQIVPILENNFVDSIDLPFSIRILARSVSAGKEKEKELDSSDTETWAEYNSVVSVETNNSGATGGQNYATTLSMPSTKAFCPQAQSTKLPIIKKSEALKKETQGPIIKPINTKLPLPLKTTNLTKQRTRVIRQRKDFIFSESDDDDFQIQTIKAKKKC
ncbi:uncharacterized protein LOC129946140 isoform X2 [Eupeodes corollae]|nr:uncharacterized protein LOC129946140 isoform X2 [Eupeodes corollae]XP_055912179.1 uncharacterized protein LOC129946140 isoform X2 [Eupeodes corollae]